MPVRLNSSGGGSVTLDVPATAGTFTATVPANTGTLVTTGSTAAVTQGMLASGVAGNGPAFSAIGSTTSIPNTTFTKLIFTTENFDTANAFDMAVGRFTPQVAGYYQFNFVLDTNQGSGGLFLDIRKNVTRFGISSATPHIPGIGNVCAGSALVFLNGTTDYVELFGYQNSGSTSTAAGSTSVSGFLARAA